RLTEELLADSLPPDEILRLVASVERYSKHPLAAAVLDAANERRLPLQPASEIAEPPGTGLRGVVDGRTVQVTSRKLLARSQPEVVEQLPPQAGGLECVILI